MARVVLWNLVYKLTLVRQQGQPENGQSWRIGKLAALVSSIAHQLAKPAWLDR